MNQFRDDMGAVGVMVVLAMVLPPVFALSIVVGAIGAVVLPPLLLAGAVLLLAATLIKHTYWRLTR